MMSACWRAEAERAGVAVERSVEPPDLLAREEACEGGTPVRLDGAGGVGGDVSAGDGEVEDLAQELHGAVGAAGGGFAVGVEPREHLGAGDAVERHWAEGGQELVRERGAGLPFVSRACTSGGGRRSRVRRRSRERAERRASPLRPARPRRWRRGTRGAPHRRLARRPRRSEVRLDRPVGSCGAGRSSSRRRDAPAPPRPGGAGVPHRVLARFGAKTGDARIGEAHSILSGHGSVPQRRGGRSRPPRAPIESAKCVYFSVVTGVR